MNFSGPICGVVLAGLMALPSQASTVTLNALGTFGELVDAEVDGFVVEPRGSFLSGALEFEVDGAGLGSFTAWCIEILELIADQATYDTDVSILTSDRETMISRLFTGFHDEAATNVGAAALQLAIWEIVEETELADIGNLATGRFVADSAKQNVITTATRFLGSLDQFGANYSINYFSSGDSQNIITVAPVPLPASAVLLVAGVGGLAMAGRRRQSASGQA